MDISPGTIVGGRYLLDRPLLRPGERLTRDRGTVWVAREGHHGAPVALKLFHPEANAAAPPFRLERGARDAALLSSRHIARVRDHGVEDGVFYMAMDLLAGEDLATRLLRRGRVSLGEAARLAAQAGEALRCAHAAGLVHQGLRPESLFIALDGDDEIVKVLDFGFPRATALRLVGEVAADVNASALHYLSPEQLRTERGLDEQTDLWSLSAILFRAVTGHLPFPGDVASVVASKILLAPAPAASRLAPRLPSALDGFFEKAFARDRARRFRSIDELVESFTQAAELAPPPSSGLGVKPVSVRGGLLDPEPARLRSASAAARLGAAAWVASAPVGREPPPARPLAGLRSVPDTQLSAARPELSRVAGPSARRWRWAWSAGVVFVFAAAAIATVSRMERANAGAVAQTGLEAAAVLSVAFGERDARAQPPAPSIAPLVAAHASSQATAASPGRNDGRAAHERGPAPSVGAPPAAPGVPARTASASGTILRPGKAAVAD